MSVDTVLPGKTFTYNYTDSKGNPQTGSVMVFPLGFRHLKKFAATVGQAIGVLSSLDLGEDGKVDTKTITRELIPFILVHAFDIFEECVTGDLENLPHFEAPEMIAYWIEESFGEGKWKGWIMTTEKLIHSMTGKKISIMEQLSNFSSNVDTQDKTS